MSQEERLQATIKRLKDNGYRTVQLLEELELIKKEMVVQI